MFSCLLSACTQPSQNTRNTTLEDITDKTGINFKHISGAFIHEDGSHSRFMPETMGSGVALFDFDSDNDIDILFINSGGFKGIQASRSGSAKLYRNDGNWHFTDVTKKSGLETNFYGMGASIADYDADGDPDILFTTLDGIRLYQNHQSYYTDVTKQVGLYTQHWTNHKGQSGTEWSTGAVFFDADGDRDLDLVTIQYVRWSVSADIYTTYDAVHKGYTSPRSYNGQSLRLWQQQQGRFTDKTQDSGLALAGKALGIALWDFDNDQKLDIVVANDTMENFLFQNLGHGRFKNIAATAEVAFDRHGNARAGMGIDIADYQNNGQAAIAIGNFSGEPTSLFRQKTAWQFSEDSQITQLYAPTLPSLTFGLVFTDLDLDGWQDIIMANGHTEPGIASAFPDQRYRQPLQWLRNLGNGNFIDAGKNIPALSTPMVGRGLATADLDSDGDLDLVATSNSGNSRLVRNNLPLQNYLRVKLHGQAPNTDAIGARIWLIGKHQTQQRMVRNGGSYLSHSELTQTFGLGSEEKIEALKVQWPDGNTTLIKSPGVNQTIEVHENASTTANL